METIQNRIEMIIRCKAVSKKSFAEQLGWSQGYLSNLLNENNSFGLQPILQILTRYRDISARWLLFGEGYMFGNIRDGLLQKIAFLGFIEKYLPAMDNEGVERYIDAITIPSFTEYAMSHIEEWRKTMQLREVVMNDNYVEILKNMGFEVK